MRREPWYVTRSVITIDIGFIGAGKVAFSLGKYFSINNLNVKSIYSKNFNSSIEFCNFVDCTPYDNLYDFINSCNFIFITTPDKEISNVWNVIKNYNLKDKIICHTSGSLSSQIFKDINKSGAYPYSIHPIYAFSTKYNNYKDLNKAFVSLEGSPKYLDYIKDLFSKLGNEVILINKNDKPLYHLSCVFASNLMLSLLNISCSLFKEFNLDEEQSFYALLPLIENNLSNIKRNGFKNSLTGPIDRKDFVTLEKHMNVIPEDFVNLYKDLSLNLCKIKGSYSSEDLQKLLNVLER